MTGFPDWPDEWLSLGLAVVWSAAAFSAGRIGYASSYRRLRSRALSALAVVAAGGLLTVGKWAADIAEWLPGDRDWQAAALLQLLLLAAPVAAVASGTFPRLLKAARLPRPDAEAMPDGAARRKVADPAVVVPVQAAAIGSCLAFYLDVYSDVPIGWADLLVPLPLLGVTTLLLWKRQRTRRRRMGRVHWTLPGLAVRAARGSLAVLVVAAALVVWLRGPGAGKVPELAGKTGVFSLWKPATTTGK
ncbi:hypothetical protein [Cohnella thermotolerans]|uniref:hypothetical protein n=1 Tax=Cohnella thermotolerans TaxID=329858 RepID=UPI0004262D8A|nr:hypothetical protein [Cohnella thermotolerans]